MKSYEVFIFFFENNNSKNLFVVIIIIIIVGVILTHFKCLLNFTYITMCFSFCHLIRSLFIYFKEISKKKKEEEKDRAF